MARVRLQDKNPVLMIIAGAACVSASAGFVKLAGTTAGTAAFFRCALALVVLVPLAIAEMRRSGPRPLRWTLIDLAAGVLLGVDYVFWAASVPAVGAAIASVLINLQIVFFPLLSWLFMRERPSARFAALAPITLTGVVMASGALGAAPGTDPSSGILYGGAAAIAYAGYLFLMRRGGTATTSHTVTPVMTATVSAAVAAALVGEGWSGIDWTPGWPAMGWLAALALLGQALALVLVGAALPRLAPGTSATLLLLHPVLSLAFATGLLGERPTWIQLAGCLVVSAAVWATAHRRRDPPVRQTLPALRGRRQPL